MGGWLIYHPERLRKEFDGVTVYYDRPGGNEDPYIWSKRFLHTYCHITQMSPEVGDTNLWVSGDHFPDFSRLDCDLVFVVEEKYRWAMPNRIEPSECESEQAYRDHYSWASKDHPFKKRSRFTLKAAGDRSFQPQSERHSLIDIVPELSKLDISVDALRKGLRAGFASRPMPLSQSVVEVISKRLSAAPVQLHGERLEAIRKSHPDLNGESSKGTRNRIACAARA